jgi:hypothetical protein
MKLKIALLLFFFSAVSFVSIAQTVHYTNTGKKYHSAGCQYLRQSDYTCSLAEAFGKGLSACSRCSPPTRVVEEKSKENPKKSVKKKTKRTTLYSPHFPSNNIRIGIFITRNKDCYETSKMC